MGSNLFEKLFNKEKKEEKPHVMYEEALQHIQQLEGKLNEPTPDTRVALEKVIDELNELLSEAEQANNIQRIDEIEARITELSKTWDVLFGQKQAS